jgi:tetratricopeptide (TPR) repeat protein
MQLNTFTGHALLLMLMALFLSACGQERVTDHPESAMEPSATSLAEIANPCAIALIPHKGEDTVDREIIRLGHQLRRDDSMFAYLERLGWAYIAKARVSFDPGFYALAEQTASCMDTRTPGSSEALLLRGHALHNQHRFASAETVARGLVKQRGLWFDYGLLGDVLMEQGNLDEAIAAYQHMMDQRPGPQAYSRAAHVRWLKGDLVGAIELMQKTVAGIGARSPESAAWAHVRLALYHLQAGQKGQAEAQLRAALRRQSLYPPALLVRGRLLLTEGRAEAAIEALTQASASNTLPEYQWALIEALHTTGQNQSAREHERRLMQRGAMDDARTFALYLAGVGKDLSTALRLVKQELQSRQDVHTLDAHAWVLHAMGRYEQAQRVIEKALAQGTEDARLFFHAGLIASSLKRYREAEDWLVRAMKIEQMLLPSERRRLHHEFATLKSQSKDLVST